MLDPVQIDIELRQNVDREADKASRAIDGMADSSRKAKKELEETIEFQRKVIDRLKQELKPLEDAFNKVNFGTNDPKIIAQRNELSKAVRGLRAELQGEEEALKSLEAANTSVAEKQQTLLTQMRAVKNEMGQLKLNGQQNTAMYRQKEEQLRTLATAHRELLKEQQLLSTGGSNVAGFMDGLRAISGMLSAGAGAMGLVNAQSENYAKLQTRIQSLMAITIGLQQVQNTLHQTSVFRLQTVARAKQAWATAIRFFNVQMGASIALSKVFVATGIGAIIAAVGLGVMALQRWIDRQREINELQQQYNETNKAVAREMATQRSNIQRLMAVAGDYTRGLDLRNKAVAELNRLMPDYNGYIDREGRLITNNAAALENYLRSLQRVERAKRLMAQIDEKNASLAELEAAGSAPLSAWQRFAVGFSRTFGFDTLDKQIDKNSQKWIEAMGKVREAKSDLEGDLQSLFAEMSDSDVADLFNFGNAAENAVNAASQDYTRAIERLKRLGADTQRETDAAIIAAMQEGKAKRLAELENEHRQRIMLIAERQREIEELERTTGVDGSRQRAQLEALSIAEEAKFEARIKAVHDGATAALNSIMSDIDSRFQTSNEKRLAEIDRFFHQQIEKAKENGATRAQLDEIEVQRRRDIELEKKHIALETLDFENQITIRRARIADKELVLAADREEKLLKIQIEAAQKRLRKLEEIQAAGGDAARDIELVTMEIAEMNAELRRIPVQRIREIGRHFQSWLSNIGGTVGGDLGESLSSIAAGVDDIMAALDKDSFSSMDAASMAINGLLQLYSLAQRQAEENRRAQEAWNDAITEAAHRARMLRLESLDYKESNVFGVENPYARAISGAKQYRAAMAELNDTMGLLANGQVQVGTKKVRSGKNIASGAASGASVGAALGTVIPVLGNGVGLVIGGLIGGLFGASKKVVVPVMDSLAKRYGDILKQGTTTFELNPAILADYGKLDASTKKLVDNWEEIRKKALEAEEQMRQTFKDLAGDIGSSLSNALINAFRNNALDAAMGDFHNKISKTIESILEQLIFAAYFQDLFDELEDRMAKSFDVGGDGDIVDDIIWFANVSKQRNEDFLRAMQTAREEMKGQGFDLWQPDGERQAAQKGIAQASQDSIDEFNGRLTHLVMIASGISAICLSSADVGKEQLVVLRAMLGHLDVIAGNSEFLAHLKSISEDIAKMRDGININR